MIIWNKIRILGIGSYGIVILAAIANNNERLIAIKNSRTPKLAKSLKKEAHIQNQFSGCEDIIQLIESQIKTESGNPIHILLMEYAPHGSLLDLMKKKKQVFHEKEARIYTRMILKALSKIHQRGIVHCNLKPSNILLFPSESSYNYYHVKIGDFGLSKIIADEKLEAEFRVDELRDALGYMSPEHKAQIDSSLDILSVGCILSEMIMGLSSSAWCNIDNAKKRLSQHKMSSDCMDFLRKCFVSKPSERYTADMLLEHPFLYVDYDIFRGFTGISRNFSSFFSYEFDTV